MAEVAGAHQLRRLLDAVVAVGSELSLPVVLRRIVETATDLVDARYGALGVLDRAGTGLAEFVKSHGRGELEKGNVATALLGGAIIGGAIASSRPAYAAPAPVYVDDYPACRMVRQRFWDGYGWRVRRVQVCD